MCRARIKPESEVSDEEKSFISLQVRLGPTELSVNQFTSLPIHQYNSAILPPPPFPHAELNYNLQPFELFRKLQF